MHSISYIHVFLAMSKNISYNFTHIRVFCKQRRIYIYVYKQVHLVTETVFALYTPEVIFVCCPPVDRNRFCTQISSVRAIQRVSDRRILYQSIQVRFGHASNAFKMVAQNQQIQANYNVKSLVYCIYS